jgi:hypothetical protein
MSDNNNTKVKVCVTAEYNNETGKFSEEKVDITVGDTNDITSVDAAVQKIGELSAHAGDATGADGDGAQDKSDANKPATAPGANNTAPGANNGANSDIKAKKDAAIVAQQNLKALKQNPSSSNSDIEKASTDLKIAKAALMQSNEVLKANNPSGGGRSKAKRRRPKRVGTKKKKHTKRQRRYGGKTKKQ